LETGVREEAGEELFKVFLTGSGAVTGLTTSELAAETVARVWGVTGWRKAGVKALTRGIVGSVFYGLSLTIGGVVGFFLFVACAGAVGGIALDVLEVFVPGGVKGLAEDIAVRVMATRKTAEKLARRIEEEELGAGEETPVEEELFTITG